MKPRQMRSGFRAELPTLGLLVLCYGVYLGTMLFAQTLGPWLFALLLTPALVLFSSLQHEILHGHPTKNPHLNAALVFPAIGLFVPYLRFKDTHLAHHYDPHLTDPYDDPESNFLDPKIWARFSTWRKQLGRFNNTLLGRMLVGPVLGLLVFYGQDLRAMVQGNRRILLSYAHHAIGLVPVIWLLSMLAWPWVLAYLIAAYLAMSVLKIRTFLEHTAHERVAARSVVIEDRGPLALLFLNNNFHATHHAYPQLVWHALPAKFRANRDYYLKRNGHYWFRSYGEVFARFFFVAKDPVAHPLWPSADQQYRHHGPAGGQVARERDPLCPNALPVFSQNQDP